jgi:tetrahydromethanopterin S-methyltransferase subunit B
MSKYFVTPVTPRLAPTFEERVTNAILDLEMRVDKLEKQVDEHMDY